MKQFLPLYFLLFVISTPKAQNYENVAQVTCNPFYKTTISGDNQYVYTGKIDGSIVVTDLSSGFVTDVLHRHTDAVMALAISNDDEKLLSGSGEADARVILWDLSNGNKPIKSFLGAHTSGHILDVVFVDDDKMLSAGKDGKLVLWDLEPLNIWDIQKKTLKTNLKANSIANIINTLQVVQEITRSGFGMLIRSVR